MDTATSADNAPLAAGIPSVRRNGQVSACEVCRRGKLRCDHAFPTCGRCARRNKPEQCIYHPAPLTKPRSPSTNGVQKTTTHARCSLKTPYPSASIDRRSSGLVSPPSSNGHDFSDFANFRPVNSSTLQPPAAPAAAPMTAEERHSTSSQACTSPEGSMSFREGKVGFLGATSYSAILKEHSVGAGMCDPDEVEDTPDLPPVSAERIQQGAELLALLRDIPLFEKFTLRWYSLYEGILVMRPAWSIWIKELWSEYGRLLIEGKPDQLRNLSELVWRNTRKPMSIHGQMTAQEWAMAASGRNLRWEVVGIILTLVGLVAANVSDWNSIFKDIPQYIDRATFAERMRKASEFCLCFCYEAEVLNDLYVTFMYEDLVLVECMKGDAHYAAWQRTGEVCDAVVAMGLHQGNKVDAKTPFFLSELRKKIFISAYGRDKQIATFLGRPPRLSYRYCKMEMPLDLTDEVFFLHGAELEARLASVDERGWSHSGELCRNTWCRVWFQHSRLREDILEIALGSDEEDISLKSQHIKQNLERDHASYPAIMRVPPEELFQGNDGKTYGIAHQDASLRGINAIFILCIHAGILHTEFLLQRAIISRKNADYKELIPISRKILNLVLLAQSHREVFRDFHSDLTYVWTVYGLPTAGVLAIELLKQNQSGQYTPDLLPRSETIQDLSVFVSALATVGPGEGNYYVCNQGRKALKRVLDQILSPPPPPPAPDAGQPAFDEMSLFFPTANDADFLSWLETVEWPGAGQGSGQAPQ